MFGSGLDPTLSQCADVLADFVQNPNVVAAPCDSVGIARGKSECPGFSLAVTEAG